MDLVARAKAILLSPNSEWPVIAGEPAETAGLYKSYILPMAAIPPVCAFIGFSIFFGRYGFGYGILGLIAQYVLALIAVYVIALIAQWLAPRFGGTSEFIPALKLVAYSHTASWVGGIFLLIPFLGILSFLMTLYGLYLLYAGATPVMSVPGERAITFTAALILGVIAVFIIVGFIIRFLFGAAMMGMI
ncbi:MAG TPA: Yip1 family protein [Stellaceae bacterium]|jgi:hypothetical protein|nr:Yip1 family protein [Stellaceae bacterium]